MNVQYLTILLLNALFLLENLKAKYLLVKIKENTIEGFRKTNNIDRITNSFRAGNGKTNKGNPSKGEASKGEPSKRGATKQDPSIEGPSPCKKIKGEDCEGKF